mgnify:CR=1 FL=1
MPEHKALLTLQAIVNDLAARTKPCEGANLPTHPTWDTKCPVVGCACQGTSTVHTFPWLWEKCPAVDECAGPDVKPLHQRCGLCDGSGQRVRRAWMVHLEEGIQALCDVGARAVSFTNPIKATLEQMPIMCEAYPLAKGVGDTFLEAALRALHAAVTAHDPA